MSSIDRRHFLGAVAAAGAGVATVAAHPRVASAQEGGKARVTRIRRNDAIDEADAVNADAVKSMVGQTVAKLFGKNTAEEAWKSLFGPSDVVAVKVNCLFGPGACTHPEVANAVVAGLLSAGVPADKITVWDREDKHLIVCGYEINRDAGVKCMGTQWDAEPTLSGSVNGKLAQILTSPETTALVNVPVLKTHSMPGITLAHKNHYGSIDNPGAHHGTNCDPYLTDLNALPCIKDKTRLIVADALRPVGEGGPSAQPQNTWSYGGILAATNPVAIDAVGVAIIDEWRATKGMDSVLPRARFLQTSEKAGLGTADLSQIDLVDL